MKAVIYEDYGPPSVLKLTEMPREEPASGQILVRNRAASLNPVDARLRDGELKGVVPGGFPRIPGYDIAGTVEDAGDSPEFHFGDRVLGFSARYLGGAYAEYSLCRDDCLARIPDTLSFEEGAALPLAGSTALQCLRQHGDLTPDDHVLVIGATGGVGGFGVQIAKAFGGIVDGVGRGDHESFARELGVDGFINYEDEDFAKSGQHWDVIFDAAGKSSYLETRPVLSEDGRYVTTEPSLGGLLASIATLPLQQQARIMLTQSRREDLLELLDLHAAGKLEITLDEVFPLERAADAHEKLEHEHFCGKLVLAIPG